MSANGFEAEKIVTGWTHFDQIGMNECGCIVMYDIPSDQYVDFFFTSKLTTYYFHSLSLGCVYSLYHRLLG